MPDIAERFEQYRLRFVEAMDARNLTNEEVADRMGAHSVTVSKLRRGKIRLDDEWRLKTSQALRLTEDILYGSGPLPAPKAFDIFVSPKKAARRAAKARAANDNLPVYGLAAGSIQGAHAMTSDPVDEIECPPGLRDVVGAYALETRGESMIPRYFPRDTLYVNPNQSIRKGDHVVIQTRLHDSSGTETWVKRFDGDSDDEIEAWQYNPPATITFKKRYVMHMHRVLPVNELFPRNKKS